MLVLVLVLVLVLLQINYRDFTELGSTLAEIDSLKAELSV